MNPASVRIDGRNWSIVVEPQVHDDVGNAASGLCLRQSRTIKVAVAPEQWMRDTLFHEIVHASCPSLSERAVAEVERGLYAVLADNADLRCWLWPLPPLAPAPKVETDGDTTSFT